MDDADWAGGWAGAWEVGVAAPSPMPSLNSFCALPRFLASLGSCEPPKSTRTTTRMMINSGPPGMPTRYPTKIIAGVQVTNSSGGGAGSPRKPKPGAERQAPMVLRATWARWRRMRRRSRSDNPPQIPNFSPFCNANSKQS